VISFSNSYIFDKRAIEIWSDQSTLQRWLDVEAALAQVQASLGIIPTTAAERIAEFARAKNFDLSHLSEAIGFAQHPLVPILKDFVALCGAQHGGWIHWGATTQNVFDTAQAIQIQETIDLLISTLHSIISRLSAMATEHAATLQAGRTHGQHALPITFGYKISCWILELQRHVARLIHLRTSACVVRMGGAVGTYAAMKERGKEVEARIAIHFGLTAPVIGGRSDCDQQAEYISVLGILSATCEKIALNIFFMQRTEIAELEENHYQGRVGSSTMAQKRNPQEAQRIMMLARLVRSRVPLALESMIRQEEGDAVMAHVMDYTLPETSIFAASILHALQGLLTTLRVRPETMRRNLNIGGGLIMAESVMMKLAERIGRDRAHHLVHQAAEDCAERNANFGEAVRRHAQAAGIDPVIVDDELFDPANYLGESIRIVAEVTAKAASPT
jgi:adenylosuccinate lyase/3-carboxy-cis,cis-muconate cycloisomerase